MPSENIPFPHDARLTAAELLIFLPNCIKCADIVYRLFSNGGTRQAIYAIIQFNRVLRDGEWNVNFCGSTMYRAMRRSGFDNWTCGIHMQWHKDHMSNWDENDLSVAGFKTPYESSGNGKPCQSIPFAQLATDVRHFPTGSDALDLTRMVEYSVNNVGERWMYPTDYGTLLNKIGGPSVVTTEHIDRFVLTRWDKLGTQAGSKNSRAASLNSVPPPSLTAPPTPFSSRLLAVVAPNQTPPQPIEQRSSQTRLLPAQLQLQKRLPKTKSYSNLEQEQPKKRGRPRQSFGVNKLEASSAKHLPPLTEETAFLGEDYEADDAVWRSHQQPRDRSPTDPAFVEYVRGPAHRTTPPTSTLHWFSVDNWAHEGDSLIEREGEPYEIDIFSPYAFSGPRHKPPYRPLYKIKEPRPDDISGWAENIRWAAEQYIVFRVRDWMETPEHMTLIASHRVQQIWASDAWLEQHVRRREKEKLKRLEMEEEKKPSDPFGIEDMLRERMSSGFKDVTDSNLDVLQ